VVKATRVLGYSLLNKGCVHIVALPFIYIKKYLKAKINKIMESSNIMRSFCPKSLFHKKII
jgi:hypothetical protein